MQEQNIFIAVKDPKEKNSILFSLAQNRSMIAIKSLEPNSIVFQVKAYDLQQTELRCMIKGAEIESLPKKDEVIVQFQSGDEKFVCQARFERELDMAKIRFDMPLFKIQRRADFRIRIPQVYSAHLVVSTHKIPVLDLSAGGCKLQVPIEALSFKNFTGDLRLTNYEPIALQCEIRHRSKDPKNPRLENLGVQFKSLNPRTKNHLVSIVMDIYRDYFRKAS